MNQKKGNIHYINAFTILARFTNISQILIIVTLFVTLFSGNFATFAPNFIT